MGNVYVQKRGKVYQYQFAIASIDGKRKYKNKCDLSKVKGVQVIQGLNSERETINQIENIIIRNRGN